MLDMGKYHMKGSIGLRFRVLFFRGSNLPVLLLFIIIIMATASIATVTISQSFRLLCAYTTVRNPRISVLLTSCPFGRLVSVGLGGQLCVALFPELPYWEVSEQIEYLPQKILIKEPVSGWGIQLVVYVHHFSFEKRVEVLKHARHGSIHGAVGLSVLTFSTYVEVTQESLRAESMFCSHLVLCECRVVSIASPWTNSVLCTASSPFHCVDTLTNFGLVLDT